MWDYEENMIDKMMTKIMKNTEYVDFVKDKYIEAFKDNKILFEKIYSSIQKSKKSLFELMIKDKNNDMAWNIFNRIYYEYMLDYPDDYAKTMKLCSKQDLLIPKKLFKKMFLINNYDDLKTFFLKN